MSCEVCQVYWDRFLDTFDPNPFVLWVFGTTIYAVLVLTVVASLYMFMDITNIPVAMRKYKIQPGTNEPLTWCQVKELVKTALINMLPVQVPSLAVLHLVYVAINGESDLRTLPSIGSIFYTIAICLLSYEIGFYYSHRLMHSKKFYKTIHKKHHEWISPVALAAVYAHPVEHVFSNVVPIYLGIILSNAHLISAWAWVTFALFSTLHDHSGYHLPFLNSSERHDFHHQKFICAAKAIALQWYRLNEVRRRLTQSVDSSNGNVFYFDRHRGMKIGL